MSKRNSRQNRKKNKNKRGILDRTTGNDDGKEEKERSPIQSNINYNKTKSTNNTYTKPRYRWESPGKAPRLPTHLNDLDEARERIKIATQWYKFRNAPVIYIINHCTPTINNIKQWISSIATTNFNKWVIGAMTIYLLGIMVALVRFTTYTVIIMVLSIFLIRILMDRFIYLLLNPKHIAGTFSKYFFLTLREAMKTYIKQIIHHNTIPKVTTIDPDINIHHLKKEHKDEVVNRCPWQIKYQNQSFYEFAENIRKCYAHSDWQIEMKGSDGIILFNGSHLREGCPLDRFMVWADRWAECYRDKVNEWKNKHHVLE